MMNAAFSRLSAEKQENIINRAILEFSNNSFADASTDAIAEDTGIAKGSLFYYFGNKKGLYLYALKYSTERIVDYTKTRTITGESFGEVAMGFFRSRIHFMRENLEITRFVSRASREYNAEVISERLEIINDYLNAFEAGTSSIVESAIDKAKLRVSHKVAADSMSMYWMAITMFLLDRYKENEERFLMEDGKLYVIIGSYVDILEHGISVD